MATHQRHHHKAADLVTARLHGVVSRHVSRAGWRVPTGEALDAAVAELQEVATVDKGLRTDLMTEVAGVCLGASRVGGIEAPLYAAKAALLVAAGAGQDAEGLERWAVVGLERMSRPSRAPAFTRPLGATSQDREMLDP